MTDVDHCNILQHTATYCNNCSCHLSGEFCWIWPDHRSLLHYHDMERLQNTQGPERLCHSGSARPNFGRPEQTRKKAPLSTSSQTLVTADSVHKMFHDISRVSSEAFQRQTALEHLSESGGEVWSKINSLRST